MLSSFGKKILCNSLFFTTREDTKIIQVASIIYINLRCYLITMIAPRNDGRVGEKTLWKALYRQSTGVVGDSLKGSEMTGDVQLAQHAMRLDDILHTEPGNSRRFALVLERARAEAWGMLDEMQKSDVASKLEPEMRDSVQNGLFELMSIGKQIRDRGREKMDDSAPVVYRKGITNRYFARNLNGSSEISVYAGNSLLRLADVLHGSATDQSGRIIWKWKDRVRAAELLLTDIREKTREAYGSGRVDFDFAQRIYIDARKALEIGIEKSSYLKGKSEEYKAANGIYSPLTLMNSSWVQPVRAVENERPVVREVSFREWFREGIRYYGSALSGIFAPAVKRVSSWLF